MRLLTLIKGNKIVVPLSVLAALAMLVINELSYWHTSRYTQESLLIMRTQITLGELQARMLNAETSQRGFLLTGQLEYLAPYQTASAPATEDFEELRQRYANAPPQLAMIAELESLSIAKLNDIAQTIILQKDNLSPADLGKFLVSNGRGKMLRMRAITTELIELEANNLIASQMRTAKALLLSRLAIALLSVMCLLAILIYLRKNLELKAEQLQLRRMLAAERDQLGLVVLKRTEELTRLARYLQNNREDERSRLARNLHDDLGALLTSAKLDTARIKSRMLQISPEMVELLTHLVGNLDGSIALGRKIIEDLRPSALNNLGLVATLEIFAREFAESSDMQVHNSFEEVDLPVDSQLMVYRLMQEACTNIMKYAGAANVWLTLGIKDGAIVASVRDDGRGFDTDTRLNASYGLLGMRFRVEAAQGVLNIISSPGKGTLVQALL